MTKKRFYISCDSNQNIYDDALKCYYSSIDAKKLCKLLNELNEENNALKSDRYRFEEEARLFALSKLDKVFDLIDEKIREYSSLEQRERTSNDTIEILKKLKKELQE